jgi:hypothetical protein
MKVDNTFEHLKKDFWVFADLKRELAEWQKVINVQIPLKVLRSRLPK